jgi:divalent metal cation (Fe/Co/Zn/Cd) transporter
MNLNNWKAVDYIIAFLAIIIGMFIILSVLGPLFTHQPMTDNKAKLIASIVTSVISIISVYVGSQIQKYKEYRNGNQEKASGQRIRDDKEK